MATPKSITTEDLAVWRTPERDLVVIDVLPEPYFRAKRIRDAINACVYEVAFLDNVREQVPSPDAEIVVYSAGQGCQAARVAAERLAAIGYRNIAVLDGGLDAWTKNGGDTDGDDPDFWDAEPGIVSGDDATYHADPTNSVLKWAGRNVNSTHTGTAPVTEGAIEVRKRIVTNGRFTIDMTGMACDDITDETYNKLLIDHLKSDDFFAVAVYPQVVFEISRTDAIPSSAPGSPNITVTGALSIRDITKTIAFPAIICAVPDGGLRFLAEIEIDRTVWNVCYGSGKLFRKLGMHLVNDMVSIAFRITANRL